MEASRTVYKVIVKQFNTVSSTTYLDKLCELTNIIALSYYKEVNQQGVAKIVFPALDNNLLDATGTTDILGKNCHIEIKRRVYNQNASLAIPWYSDFVGVIRGKRYFQDAQGRDYVEITVFSLLTLLSWRVVAWKSVDGIADNRTNFIGQKAETILKTLVTYNAGSGSLVSNGRVANGVIPNFTVQTDAAGGATMNYDCAFYNLLTAAQEICKVGGGDVDVVLNGTNYDFRFYSGQLGTDRSSTGVAANRLTFSAAQGNITEPEYSVDWDHEKTVCIVGGMGTCQARKVTVVTGNGFVYQSNDYEIFADARQSKNSPVDVGNIELYNNRARYNFTFKVQQVPGCRYGLHYFLGDLATAQYKNNQKTVKIQRVNVTFSGSEGEKIEILTRTL